VQCQAVKAFEAPPLFVNEIDVIFGKGLGSIDEQLELLAENMIRLSTSEDNLKSFEVGSLFEDPLHPLRLDNVDPQHGAAVRLGIPFRDFPGNVTAESRAMERRCFAPKLGRITAHADENSRRATGALLLLSFSWKSMVLSM
jgi:hypothetical protein